MEPDPKRLAALEARIEALKDSQGRKPKATGTGFSQGEVAWRMVLELATGIGLGTAIGYGIDTLVGTVPLFLVIFCLLGFAAGIKTMLGTAKQLNAAPAAPEKSATTVASDEGE